MKALLNIFIAIGIFLCSTDVAITDDVYGCYDLQREFLRVHGEAAPLYYWYPKCLTGGYYQNVQCDYYGCYCAYVDTGVKIPETVENAFVEYMRDACPWLSQKVPDACAMPPEDYPCKKYSRKFYFNAANGKCEANSKSCLGFDTKKACEESCVVQKKDRCNFRVGEGRTCDRREPGERWYHDENKKACRPFLYKGCGGNSNNYQEKWICLKTCAKGQTTELIIQVDNTKYIIGLPTWIIVQRGFVPHAPNKLTVEEFKDIEGYLTEIAKFPVKEEDKPKEEDEEKRRIEQKLAETEKYRPKHAPKNMSREELCGMKKSPGPCRGFFPRWYFDKKESKCIKFIYGGCYGNENRHKSATGCAAFCDAKIPPTAAQRIEDCIMSDDQVEKCLENIEEDDGSRHLEIGIPTLETTTTASTTEAGEEVIISEGEVEYGFGYEDEGSAAGEN